MTYAALSASGSDDPLVPAAAAPIFPQIAAMKAEARAADLTDGDIDTELAAYNAERRGTRKKR